MLLPLNFLKADPGTPVEAQTVLMSPSPRPRWGQLQTVAEAPPLPHISSRGRCPTPKPVQASPSKLVCKAEPGWAGVCKDLKAGEVFTGSHHTASPQHL